MISPTLDEVKQLLKDYKTIPVFEEFLIDSFTPIAMFNALHKAYDDCFILESVDNNEQWGRYSFVGINPKAEIMIKDHNATITRKGKYPSMTRVDDPISFLSNILEKYRSPKMLGRPKLTGGFMGYFAYDMARYFEKTLCNPPKDDLNLPDADLFLFDEIVAFDHLTNKAIIILNIHSDDDPDQKYAQCQKHSEEIIDILKNYKEPERKKSEPREITVKSNMTKEEYCQKVIKAKEYIRNGDIFQIVPSQRFELDNPPDSFDVYRMLRTTNPSPYLFYFKHNDYAVAGASPEMLVNVENGHVTNRPIAGTIKRGLTVEEDIANEKKLVADPKEGAEHNMLVDLGRNDVGKVCKFGTVEVTHLRQVERYSKIMHLVSTVEGSLREDKKPLDALMAVLPAGTLSGAPKVRAMEIIDELEPNKRGLYGGTVGYLAFDGSIDTCIAIRTALFKNGKAYVQAGGGVVADSVPENEYQESVNKSFAVINAIKLAAKM